ncbi:MAG: putative nucleotidyltransferase [Candidatus Woesearchaeota archaeon]|jgi:predicted nucleotidyltransferase
MITKSIKQRLKEYYFLNPDSKLRVRQVERTVDVPLPSAIRYTKELEEEGILRSSQITNVIFYSADRASKIFLLEKRLFNIHQLHVSGLIEALITRLSNPTIIIFGSYSKGEDTSESDIDIYIETQSKDKINFKKFETILQRKIQIFSYTSISKVENKELANNILNGITLNGFVEVFE